MGINMHIQTKFWEWAKQTFTPHYIKEIEEFLKDAKDESELEYKMITLARRGLI